MAEDSGYYGTPFEGQTISPTQPTWKDRIAQMLLGDQRPSVERRNFVEGLMGTSGIGPSGLGIASLTPAGPVLDAQEAAQAGDYRSAALAAIPVPGAAKAGRSIRAYHGSPHDFERFDASKIGTGEGAQSYGRGLYFAEKEGVAKGYRDKLAEEKKGRMYEVDIKADPEQFIDWDKPFAGQSGYVQDRLLKIPQFKERLGNLEDSTPLGFMMKRGHLPSTYDISDVPFQKTYSETGISGVKYLDQGSRSAGDGTRNYVVFDDSLVEILRKYGLVPGGLAGAGVAASGSEAEAAPQGYNQGGLVSRMPMTQYLNALGTIESGNNYSALGPRTESGNQAYGRYQVMDFNIPVWTKEVLGSPLTPQQFLEDRKA